MNNKRKRKKKKPRLFNRDDITVLMTSAHRCLKPLFPGSTLNMEDPGHMALPRGRGRDILGSADMYGDHVAALMSPGVHLTYIKNISEHGLISKTLIQIPFCKCDTWDQAQGLKQAGPHSTPALHPAPHVPLTRLSPQITGLAEQALCRAFAFVSLLQQSSTCTILSGLL
jgi:hypothetical protein